MTRMAAALILISGVFGLLGTQVKASTDDTDAMASAVQVLSQELRVHAACHLGKTPRIGIWPLDADTLPIPDDTAVHIYEDVLGQLLAAKPDCATFLDGAGASDTLDYLNKTGAFQLLGNTPRADIDAAFRQVDFIVSLGITEQSSKVRASLKLTTPGGGTIAAPPAFNLPDTLLHQSCGSGAVPLGTALRRAAKSLVNDAPTMRALVNKGGYFADTDEQTDFSTYAGSVLVGELVRAYADPLSNKQLLVAEQDAPTSAEVFQLSFRYWPCEDSKRMVLTVELQSKAGATVSWRGAALAADLPEGVTLRPRPEPSQTWLLSVTPSRVSIGDEIAVVAEAPSSCAPAFVDFTASGKATVIPQVYFSTEQLADGGRRFTVDASTRYGLKITAEDEKGIHHLGFFCLATGEDVSPDMLRALWLKLATTSGRETQDQAGRNFWFERFEVR